MNYELALKLKNAGFREDIYLYEETKEVGNAPTLSELIDACRKLYYENMKEYSFFLDWSIDKWFAGFSDENDKGTPILQNGEGSTPLIAVASLWLSLNEMKKAEDMKV
jgi:hypothetical protein